MILLFIATAWPHPQDNEYYGHALLAELQGTHLSVEYQFEIPNSAVKREPGDPIESMYAQLVSGISLKSNGKALSPTITTGDATEEGVFTRFVVHLATEVPKEPLALEFGNATAPEIPSVFLVDLRLAGDWKATASSVDNISPSNWYLDESLRKVTLEVKPRPWGWGAPLPLGEASGRFDSLGLLFAGIGTAATAGWLGFRQRRYLSSRRV